MKRFGKISAAALFLLLGNTLVAGSPPVQGKGKQNQRHDQSQNNQKGQERAQQAHEANAERQLQRLSDKEQQQRIRLTQKRMKVYQRNLDRQINLAPQRTARLQRQQRMQQYRFQTDYYQRLRQQQLNLRSATNDNYNDDPYYYTASNFRYNRGGTYYQTNQYGADLLRQAVNNGYREGILAGQADREDRWSSNYRSSYAYQDANYGYDGRYVQQDEYNYYFRQGFSRGYADGFGSNSQYGGYTNGNNGILANVLSQILNLQSLR